MLPLTTDVRLKRGIPKAVTAIIVGTFLLHVGVDIAIANQWVDPDFRQKSMSFHFEDPDFGDWLMSIFSHSGYMHWFGNMIFLWIFGSILEDRLGSIKFFLLYLFCGFTATALHLGLLTLFLAESNHPAVVNQGSTIGASGAIMGIMGLTIVRFYKAKVRLFLILFVRPLVLNIPLWVFCAYEVASNLLGLLSRDHVDHLAHLGGFLGAMAIAPLLKLKKEGDTEIKMDEGTEFLKAGLYRDAVGDFQRVVQLQPGNALAWEKLGFSYWNQNKPGKADLGEIRAESLECFQKALELYLQAENYSEGARLYENLMKFFTDQDFPEKIPFLLKAHEEKGGIAQAVLTSNPIERVKLLKENFTGFSGRGMYSMAYETLKELEKLVPLGDMGPSQLEAAGEVCLRVEPNDAVPYFRSLAETGDENQTVRALSVLSRAWLGTHRQDELGFLHQKAGERLAKLGLFDDWIRLGEALKTTAVSAEKVPGFPPRVSESEKAGDSLADSEPKKGKKGVWTWSGILMVLAVNCFFAAFKIGSTNDQFIEKAVMVPGTIKEVHTSQKNGKNYYWSEVKIPYPEAMAQANIPHDPEIILKVRELGTQAGPLHSADEPVSLYYRMEKRQGKFLFEVKWPEELNVYQTVISILYGAAVFTFLASVLVFVLWGVKKTDAAA